MDINKQGVNENNGEKNKLYHNIKKAGHFLGLPGTFDQLPCLFHRFF